MIIFLKQIERLENNEIDHFITNRKFDVLNNDIIKPIILSGSFNPIHSGHRSLLEYVSNLLDRNKYYEISIMNVDKPALSIEELLSRIPNFSFNEKIIITNSSKFIDKVKIFPDTCFIVGYDTAVRILDESYLSDNETLDEFLNMVSSKNCFFMVAGRVDENGKFNNLKLDEIKEKYRSLFMIIDEEDFRSDISSTDIR